MSIKSKILIIAPHSYCIDRINRDCDMRAAEVAEKFAHLARGLGYSVKLFQSDVLRETVHDYNRKESFNTPWRQAIRNYIKSNESHPIIIYEIHSFPKEFTEFDKNAQMALLAIDEYYDDANNLHKYLRDSGIRISDKINRTRVVNLMVDTSKYKNIKHHYLLEFNEDKNILNERSENYAILNIFAHSLLPNRGNFGKKIFMMTFILAIIIIVILIILIIFCYRGVGKVKNYGL